MTANVEDKGMVDDGDDGYDADDDSWLWME